MSQVRIGTADRVLLGPGFTKVSGLGKAEGKGQKVEWSAADGTRDMGARRGFVGLLAGALAALRLAQLIDAVEGGLFVALRQSRVIEHRVDEVVHGSLQHHHRLAYVKQLGGAFADDVDAQDLARLAMED